MTKIKLCGMTCPADIAAANRLKPDYVGFVFAQKSRRCVTPETAAKLRALLAPEIRAVGVFVNAAPEQVAALLEQGVLDAAQLHGQEDEAYLADLRNRTKKPLIRAFRVETAQDLAAAMHSTADCVLLDSGTGGTGKAFDWTLLEHFGREYFLAGGLNAENVAQAVRRLAPFGVDVSSGIETNGRKDADKMAAFVAAVRNTERNEAL